MLATASSIAFIAVGGIHWATGINSAHTTPWVVFLPLVSAAIGYVLTAIACAPRLLPRRTLAIAALAVSVLLLVGAVASVFSDATAMWNPWMIVTPFVITMIPALITLGAVGARIARIGTGLLALVAITVVAASATTINGRNSPSLPSNSITTATVASKDSPWKGQLPDPCSTLSTRDLIRLGGNAQRDAVSEGTPDERVCAFLAFLGRDKPTWLVYVTYSTANLDERVRSDPRDPELHAATILGQRAIRSTASKNHPEDSQTCTITTGTVFGSVEYRLSRGGNRPCDKATEVATVLYPRVPTK
ncbi:DUF3558 family protein [Gordonia sp. X0973]|uniref:DUF3558 family protein n=1 Tax=Gordonia sp. X0973 TaxID=2742602 RepID=UPI0013EB7048|nr:DUF3558 family protein [Gordonia sp. X0973]QKT06974.1 DUF3558 family protein [Gordonia sp. X0973]